MKEKTNRKKLIVIAVISGVVLALIGVVVFILFSPITLDGGWKLIVNPELAASTPDEASRNTQAYYTFSEPSKYGDGTYKTYFDGGVEEGIYKLSEKDGKQYINMGTEDLEYSISGTRLFGSAKLTITYPAQTDGETGQTIPPQDYIFAHAKAPDYEKEAYPAYTIDTDLLGEWRTEDRTLSYYAYELSYTETVQIKDNGIMTIHYKSDDLALDRYLYYAYTTEDGTLTFSLVTNKETQYTVSYELDKNSDLRFTDDTSSSIFADAFFSDATYSAVK